MPSVVSGDVGPRASITNATNDQGETVIMGDAEPLPGGHGDRACEVEQRVVGDLS